MSLILKLVIIITTLPIFLADSDIALKNPEETILLDSTLLCEHNSNASTCRKRVEVRQLSTKSTAII